MSELSNMRVLVTGGAGFIGSWIVQGLVEKGARVRVYDNFSSGTEENLHGLDVEIVNGDILDFDSLKTAMLGCDMVSHHAAQLEITTCIRSPQHDLRVNAFGTLNVLKAAEIVGVKKVVVASSACVYGQAQYIPTDEKHPTNPNWAYGVSKLAAEKYCHIFSEMTGIPTVCLRYGIVYGPREWYGRVLTIFLKRALKNLPAVVFGDGSQKRDFVYVEDAAQLHNLALVTDTGMHSVFNVGTGIGTRIVDLAELVTEICSLRTPPIFEDVPEGGWSSIVEGGRMRLPNELQQMVLDPSLAGKVLGFRPRTSLSDGLSEEWRWLRNNPERWKKMSY